MDDDGYIAIPGFSHYRINRDSGEVQSDRQGRWKPRKPSYCGQIQIIDDAGNYFNVGVKRLLYAAMHGVNPEDMGRNLIVSERNGELCLFDLWAFSKHMREGKAGKSEERIRADYMEAIRFAQIVLAAYDSNDYSQVMAEIWKYEKRMYGYMRSRGIALMVEKQKELWMQVFDVTMDSIKNRRTYILNLWGYLTRTLRNLHSNFRRAHRLIKHIEDAPGVARTLDNNGRAYSRSR